MFNAQTIKCLMHVQETVQRQMAEGARSGTVKVLFTDGI